MLRIGWPISPAGGGAGGGIRVEKAFLDFDAFNVVCHGRTQNLTKNGLGEKFVDIFSV
jgi:hypothetical protein